MTDGISLLQIGGDQNWMALLQLLWILFFLIIIFYGQRIQLQLLLLELGGLVNRLDKMRIIARNEAYNKLKEKATDENKLREGFDRLLESFIIMPESMDPVGIVKKVEHILNVRETRYLNDVKRMINNVNVSEDTLKTFSNLIEAVTAVEALYKVARHYYLLARKTGNYFLAAQLQMQAPLIYGYAKAFLQAVYAFKHGIVIGDSIGPLVAHKFIQGKENVIRYENYVKDTDVYELNYLNRRILIVKARGPGGEVGKAGEAIKKLIESNEGKIKLIIMIDAALKLTGEKSGSIAEGVGAAIGGIGVDKFKIEEEATKYSIPLYAIIIKMSITEAITVMKKKIADSYIGVIKGIERVLQEETNENDCVIIAGIGNTIGIP